MTLSNLREYVALVVEATVRARVRFEPFLHLAAVSAWLIGQRASVLAHSPCCAACSALSNSNTDSISITTAFPRQLPRHSNFLAIPTPSRRPLRLLQQDANSIKRAGTSPCTCLYTQNIHKRQVHFQSLIHRRSASLLMLLILLTPPGVFGRSGKEWHSRWWPCATASTRSSPSIR